MVYKYSPETVPFPLVRSQKNLYSFLAEPNKKANALLFSQWCRVVAGSRNKISQVRKIIIHLIRKAYKVNYAQNHTKPDFKKTIKSAGLYGDEENYH